MFDIKELENLGKEYFVAQNTFFEVQEKYFKEIVEYCKKASDKSIVGKVTECETHVGIDSSYVCFTVKFNDGMTEEFSDYHGLPIVKKDDWELTYPNANTIGWHLYKRKCKEWCKYFQASYDAIGQYLATNEIIF